MADIVEGGGSGPSSGRHQKKRAKKGSARIDMTPMVDVAFLLLTFFVLTTTMYKPSTLKIAFPVPPKENEPPPDKTLFSNAITLLLTKKDQIFYYMGEFHTADDGSGKPPTTLTRTDFSKVRDLLIENNRSAVERLNDISKQFNERKIDELAYDSLRKEVKGDKANLKAIIKPDKEARYRNMIDIVDEMDITGVGSYAVVDSLKKAEQALLDIEKQTL